MRELGGEKAGGFALGRVKHRGVGLGGASLDEVKGDSGGGL